MTSPRPHGPNIGDAFGRMLLECLETDEAVTDVIERDDGHIGTGDARRYFGSQDGWSPTTWWAIERAQGRVLDVGAGAGQHSLYLQDKGFDVTGLDVSSGAIETMRRRGLRQTFLGTSHQAARRHPGEFDCAAFLGNNLGLFASPDETVRLAAALDRLLAPDGRVIGTSLDAYQTTDPDHLAYHAWSRSRGRLGGQMRIRARFGRRTTPWFDYLMVSIDEFSQLLEPTVWQIAESLTDGANYALELRRRREAPS